MARTLGPAPFLLGSAAAIHLGNTNSCIAAYDFRPGSPEYYQLCMPSWVAITDNDTILSGEAAMNHATVSPGTAISGDGHLGLHAPPQPKAQGRCGEEQDEASVAVQVLQEGGTGRHPI